MQNVPVPVCILPMHGAVPVCDVGSRRRTNVVQRHIDAVIHGKLHHASHDRTHAAQDADAVAGPSRIGIDARILDDDMHRRFIFAVSCRRLRLNQVIRAIFQHMSVGGKYAAAAKAGDLRRLGCNQTVARLRAVTDHRRTVGPHRHILRAVQVKRRTCNRIAQFVHLLHKQLVFQVRDI